MASKIARMHDVSTCDTIDMVLGQSGTDWEPKLYTPAYTVPSTGQSFEDKGSRVIVNPSTGQALGYVGDRYRSNSHRGQLMALDTLVRDGRLKPTTVSVWDGGSVLAYQFRAEGLDAVINGRDVVSPLLTLAFWHDGLGSDRSFFADFRWFCKNQMGRVGELTRDGSNVRHMGQNLTKYQELVMNRIAELGTGLQSRYETMRRMAQIHMPTPATVRYLAEVAGSPDPDLTVKNIDTLETSKLRGVDDTVEKMLRSVRKDDCGADGSLWQVYNGVTRFLTHDQGRSEASRSARALLGSGASMAQRAFDLASTIAA